MSSKKLISSAKVPHSNKALSQGVLVDNILYLSGSLGTSETAGGLVNGGIKAQARQSLKNIGFLLEEAGFSYDDVVKANVLLSDINNAKELNEVYSEFFPTSPPARACYQVGCLPMKALVEIEVIAIKGRSAPVSRL